MDDIVVVVNKKTVRYTDDFVDLYEDFKTIASVLKEHVKNTDDHKTDVVWECSCQGEKFEFVFHQDHDNDVEFQGDVPEDIDQQELEEVLTDKLVHPIMYEEEEEFEAKKDYMPGFLEALGELTELYEKENDFRATAFRRAIIALEGQIITSVEDIKLFNLIELKGVGKSTLVMLEEFITSGKIEKLEEKRPQPKANPDQVEWFATLTEEQAGYIQDYWDSEGEKKCAEENGVFGSRGIPFTFEYEGDTYKVDGDAEEDEWEGSVRGISFDGCVSKNGVEHGSFSCRIEFDGFEAGEEYQQYNLLNGEDEVVGEDEALAEVCRNEFDSAYILQGSKAYRE